MNPVSPLRELEPQKNLVSVFFGDTELRLPEGANLAAALMAAGIKTFRHTPVSGAPRAPFCMMGACYDCLIEIDGVSKQACMMQVEPDLRLSMPHGLEKDSA